jgi:hypothetical protein
VGEGGTRHILTDTGSVAACNGKERTIKFLNDFENEQSPNSDYSKNKRGLQFI